MPYFIIDIGPILLYIQCTHHALHKREGSFSMIWFLLACASALFSAAAAVVQKKVLFRITALEFSFLVSLCILGLSGFVPFAYDIASVPRTALLVIGGKSLLGASAFLCVMLSLEKNRISTALPLLGLTPAAAAILSVPVFGESLFVQEYAAVALMIAGIFLIEHMPARGVHVPTSPAPQESFALSARARFRARVPIIFALLLFAVSSVADKMIVGSMRINPWIVLFYQHAIYAGVFGVMIAARNRALPLERMKGEWLFILLAAALTVAYRFSQLEASKDAPVALVLAVKRMSIVAASFFGGRLFNDERLVPKLAGGALIVAAGFLILRYSA